MGLHFEFNDSSPQRKIMVSHEHPASQLYEVWHIGSNHLDIRRVVHDKEEDRQVHYSVSVQYNTTNTIPTIQILTKNGIETLRDATDSEIKLFKLIS